MLLRSILETRICNFHLVLLNSFSLSVIFANSSFSEASSAHCALPCISAVPWWIKVIGGAVATDNDDDQQSTLIELPVCGLLSFSKLPNANGAQMAKKKKSFSNRPPPPLSKNSAKLACKWQFVCHLIVCFRRKSGGGGGGGGGNRI